MPSATDDGDGGNGDDDGEDEDNDGENEEGEGNNQRTSILIPLKDTFYLLFYSVVGSSSKMLQICHIGM